MSGLSICGALWGWACWVGSRGGARFNVGMLDSSAEGMGWMPGADLVSRMNRLFFRVTLPEPWILILYCLCGSASTIVPILSHLPNLFCIITVVLCGNGVKLWVWESYRIFADWVVFAYASSLSFAVRIHSLCGA